MLSAESDEEKQHWYGVLRAYSHLTAEQVASAANVRSSFSLDAEADQERLPTPVMSGGKAVRRPRRSSFETDPSTMLSALEAAEQEEDDEDPEEQQQEEEGKADGKEEVAPESEEYQRYATGDKPEAEEDEPEIAGMVQLQSKFKRKFQSRTSTEGKFRALHLSITARGEVTFRRGGPAGKISRTASAVGCKVTSPKKKRKGHKHAFRVNLAKADSKQDSKYVISVSDAAELTRWIESFGKFSTMTQADIEAVEAEAMEVAEHGLEEEEDAEEEATKRAIDRLTH